MKRGFTLVEMLVVVVVLATLMTMMFRLGSIGSNSQARNETIDRMQRLENALSGYYAAFGTYPPVKLHASRNIYLKVSDHGQQDLDGEENTSIWGWYKETGSHVSNSTDERKAWEQVRAACLAQPVACEFPFSDDYEEMVKASSEENQEVMKDDADSYSESQNRIFTAGYDDGVTQNRGRHSQYKNETSWSKVRLFKFGVLSYLLPRYLFMMNGDDSFFEDFAQWTGNNSLPSDPLTGVAYTSWSKVRDYSQKETSADLAHVANIPSQAACARWMPNFESSLCCNHSFKFFGIDIRDDDHWSQQSPMTGGPGTLDVYAPGGYDNDSTAGQYILDSILMKDGWRQPLYYYSPAPYQTYVLWSGGKNERTFPPWIARDKLDSSAQKCVGYWIEDDIVGLSN